MKEFFIETDILPQTLFSFDLEDMKEKKISAIILSQDKLKNIYSLDLMGQNSKKWVREALTGYKIKEATIKNKDNYLDDIIPLLKDEDFVIILHADTPLVTSATISDAVDYATTKNLDFCKLYRGGIYKVKALKNKQFEYSAEANFLNKEDFFTIFNGETASFARKVLKQRIVLSHLKNGVEFMDRDNVYIERNVEIEKDVKIFANNVLKGHTLIKKGTILRENNIVENCLIGENCDITSSFLKDYKVKNNSKIKPFSILEGKKK